MSDNRPLAERFEEGRRLAREGYGWQDLSVRLNLPETSAKLLVMEAENRRIEKQRAQQ